MTYTTEVDVDIDLDDLFDEMSKRELLEARERIDKALSKRTSTRNINSAIIELEDINTKIELDLFEALRKIYQNRIRISSSDYKAIFEIANQL